MSQQKVDINRWSLLRGALQVHVSTYKCFCIFGWQFDQILVGGWEVQPLQPHYKVLLDWQYKIKIDLVREESTSSKNETRIYTRSHETWKPDDSNNNKEVKCVEEQ
jgi:hypothetical protein